MENRASRTTAGVEGHEAEEDVRECMLPNGMSSARTQRGGSSRRDDTNGSSRFNFRGNPTCLRHTNPERGLSSKKKVIRMLFVVVIEFFVCWAPVYALNTWATVDMDSMISYISPRFMNFVHLLAYVSTCCNPITYCFMNQKFRQAFMSAVCCCCRRFGVVTGPRTTTFRRPSDFTRTSCKTGMRSRHKWARVKIRAGHVDVETTQPKVDHNRQCLNQYKHGNSPQQAKYFTDDCDYNRYG